MSDEVVTFKVFLAGRDIEFRRAGIGQIMILERMYQRRMKQVDEDAKGDALSSMIAKTLDFIDSLIVDPEDRQFVEDEMLAGNISWQQLMGTLSGNTAEALADDQAPPVAKKAVRRSPKAAPVAKKTASSARAKR